MKWGFIMSRHVNSELTNNYWIESYNCIRKFYDNKIIIIDDNSDASYLTNIETVNCEIIESIYEQRGELLCYYYFFKNKFFDKAVIIHDSVFIKQHINFDNVENVSFLWDFTLLANNKKSELKLIKKLHNSHEIELLYNSNQWLGCFGIMSVITWNVLNKINNEYKFFDTMILHVINRKQRMCLERVFACLCYLISKKLKNKPSMFGNIHEYMKWGLTFQEYLLLCEKKECDLPIIKVWSGR